MASSVSPQPDHAETSATSPVVYRPAAGLGPPKSGLGFLIPLAGLLLVGVIVAAADEITAPPGAALGFIGLSLGAWFAALGLTLATWAREQGLARPSILYAIALVVLLAAYQAAAPHSWAIVAKPPRVTSNGSFPLLALIYALCAIGLVIAGSTNRPLRGLAYWTLRILIWLAAFWQLTFLILRRDIAPLFDGAPAIGVQMALVAGILINGYFVLRGDRSWLLLPRASEDGALMARLLLPLALVPLAGGYLVVLAVRTGWFVSTVGYLINIEVAATALFIMGVWAMRAVRKERREKDELASALTASPVIVRARNGVIQYWPGGCQDLYGWTADEAIGRVADDLLKTDYKGARDKIVAAFEKDGAWTGELRQTTKDGERRWVAVRWVLFRDFGPGGLARVVETHNDITNLKQTSEALRDSEDDLAQAVSTYDLGAMSLIGRTGRVTYSAEIERILGVEPGALGDTVEGFRSMIVPEDREPAWAKALETVAAGLDRHTHVIRVQRPDGEIRYLRGVYRFTYAVSGGLSRANALYMDVTTEYQARFELDSRAERLVEMHKMLAHVSRLSAMGEMAAALAHELNQPLTAVGNSAGAIELLLADESRPIDDRIRSRIVRAAKHTHAQAVRAGEIMRRLRDFVSRGEADTQDTDLLALVDDALALVLPSPSAARIDVKIDAPPETRRVLIDRVQIEQVMVNLVRNAVESMRGQDTPKRLTITATLRASMTEVSVVDSGPGVPPEMVDRLFSPFQSTKSDGMGVGLSICRRIIEAHGGRMWLAPTEGEDGADFRFTLPVRDSGDEPRFGAAA